MHAYTPLYFSYIHMYFMILDGDLWPNSIETDIWKFFYALGEKSLVLVENKSWQKSYAHFGWPKMGLNELVFI